MLPPGYLESLPDAVVELIQEMEDAILSKMAIRITKYGWTDQSQWEKDRLEAVGVVRSDIVRILSNIPGKRSRQYRQSWRTLGGQPLRRIGGTMRPLECGKRKPSTGKP